MKDVWVLLIFGILFGAVCAVGGVLSRQNTELRAKLAVAEQPLVCRCSLYGSMDEVAWDINLGEVKATVSTNGERYLPARSACGPLQLRASTGVDAP